MGCRKFPNLGVPTSCPYSYHIEGYFLSYCSDPFYIKKEQKDGSSLFCIIIFFPLTWYQSIKDLCLRSSSIKCCWKEHEDIQHLKRLHAPPLLKTVTQLVVSKNSELSHCSQLLLFLVVGQQILSYFRPSSTYLGSRCSWWPLIEFDSRIASLVDPRWFSNILHHS